MSGATGDDRNGQDPSYWLEDERGRRYYLDGVATIGRGTDNDIRVESAIVSRYHALLRLTGGQWTLTDLESRNGTRLNGRDVEYPQQVSPDDEIHFADRLYVLRYLGPSLEAREPAGPPAFETRQTDNFEINIVDGSYAGRHLEYIASRVEQFRSAAVSVLQLTPATEPFRLFLVDDVSQVYPDAQPGMEGYASPDANAIVEIYRSDAPGASLERLLLDVLTYQAYGRAPDWPAQVRNAALTLIDEEAGRALASDEDLDLLAEALLDERLPDAGLLLGDREPEDVTLTTAAATSLLRYIGIRFGADALGRAFAELAAADPRTAIQQAVGRSLKSVDDSWRKDLKERSATGLRLFFRLVRPYLRPYRFRVAEIAFYVVLSVAFSIALARAQGFIFDEALIAGDRRLFGFIVIGLVLWFVFSSLLTLRESYVKEFVSERIAMDMRGALFGRLQVLDDRYYDRSESGDLITRMTTDLQRVQSALTQGVTEFLRLTVLFVAAMVTIIVTDWRLAFVAVIAAPFFLLTGRYLGPPVARASIERQQNYSLLTSFLHENLAVRAVVRLFGLERVMSGRFKTRQDEFFHSARRVTLLSGVYVTILTAASYAAEISVLAIGGYLVLEGNMSPGELVTLIFLVGLVIEPLQSVSGILQIIQRSTGSMQRVDELATTNTEIYNQEASQDIGPLAREIRLDHVTFGYDPAEPVLRELDLTIQAGSTVAIVGPSGSGKSTVFNLLTRFYDPQVGRVTFDGVDLRAATLESIRGQIGMVLQDNILLNESIMENIRLGSEGATDEQVIAAAQAAEIHEFIERLPEGYDTFVGERGGMLSGGQRQRVAIARAIVRNPTLLFLDEATSALDPGTEAAINQTLRQIGTGRTSISVTHRLASITHVDTIFVLDGGRLIEQGSHQELLGRRGLYYRLWMEQEGGADDAAAEVNRVVEQLRSVPLLEGLNHDLLVRLCQLTESSSFERGDTIIQQGEVGDRMYLISEGTVAVLSEEPGRPPRQLAQLREGEHFGEIALIQDIPRTATVSALTDVTLLTLMKKDLDSLMHEFPRLRAAINDAISSRVA